MSHCIVDECNPCTLLYDEHDVLYGPNYRHRSSSKASMFWISIFVRISDGSRPRPRLWPALARLRKEGRSERD
jgi:hypothetical protein